MHQTVEELRRQLERGNAAPLNPIRNLHAYRDVINPPVNNRIIANNFELSQGLIQRAESNSFGGIATEDPNEHLTTFVQISNTVKLNGVPGNEVCLRLFPFSLRDSAKDWYNRLRPDSIETWPQMVTVFLDKYFPPNESFKRKNELLMFMMKPHESDREAWERYNKLLRKCHKHGLSPGQQVTLYRGALPEVWTSLNNSAGGAFMNMEEADALALIERVVSGDGDWDNERNNSYRVATTTNSDDMAAKIEYLIRELEMMKTGQSGANVQAEVEDVNYVHQGGNRNFNNYRPNHGGGNYN